MQIPDECLAPSFNKRLICIIRLQLGDFGLSANTCDDDLFELVRDVLQEAHKRVFARAKQPRDPNPTDTSSRWLAFYSGFTRNIVMEKWRMQKRVRKELGNKVTPSHNLDSPDDQNILDVIAEQCGDPAMSAERMMLVHEMCRIALEEVDKMHCRPAFKKVVEMICVEHMDRDEALEAVAAMGYEPMHRSSYWRLFSLLEQRILLRHVKNAKTCSKENQDDKQS